jgi:ABC-2 type transport system ATP-binding protein
MSGATVIRLEGLTKRYGRTVAVDGIDLEIREGEVFGLLGPNGSGKTTTILMLMGLTERDGGTLDILGFDPTRQALSVKRRVGYMPDSLGFYESMSARQNLRYTGRLLGLHGAELEGRIDGVLATVGLRDAADGRVATFSRGMEQRLGLAEILLKRPKIAILDEPTSGLDPEASHRFLGMIRGLRANGSTVLLSSHLLDQVQAVCDRVALFHVGRIVMQGRVDEIARSVLGETRRFRVEGRGDGIAAALRSLAGVAAVEEHAEGIFTIDAGRDIRRDIVALFGRQGRELTSLSVVEPSLDEVYRRYFEERRDAA